MISVDFTKLSRRQLIAHFERERQAWLEAGMSEADIFRIHFGEITGNGRGGDYRMWLDERKHIRADRKYSYGTPVTIHDTDDSLWIVNGYSELDDVEFNIDLKVAFSKLTELQRFCFVEAVMNDRKQQVIADDLGIKQQVVGRHIKAAKEKLKKYFSG